MGRIELESNENCQNPSQDVINAPSGDRTYEEERLMEQK